MIRVYVFICSSIIVANSCFAAVIERDWKLPGDGLLSIDNVNQREWLDLSQTLLSDQFPGTGVNSLVVREVRYQYVVSQTAPGGLFAGFSVAKPADVIALAQSAGIDTSTDSFSINSGPVSVLQQLLGITLERPDTNKYSIGMLDDLGTLSYPFRLGATFQLTNRAELIVSDPTVLLQSDGPHSVMLFRQIPEPSALAISVSSLINLQLIVRHRRRKSVLQLS
jgi:hypothetical protein